ncbi:NAD/NADP octopine/nopaline dehydrogenase family protein [Bosea sp. SSUT16]|uniref:2-dehydropantoate 2-reductase n=1 Tax=Bosea spartocytisi TaxID=2773451 RepID=A0A927HZ92_9HYPH|nr:NAD/NADP octopine/nopaline dehydrogenase family protein [Bosea spartocytisi]MBD3846029.1 NAD/NADP octopine/nopaline dehydrogenase family protein [Bosea spartocytisi]MCT4473213.1 NAD/NADP octopine/nopaline dehydrogenase family protein [Bosea spartocytisi]
MRVAIIGFGGIGRGYAAYLTVQGHEPVIWSPSGAALADFAEDASLTVTGKLETAVPLRIARDCAEAVAGAEAVIVTVQANGFKTALDALAPHLVAGQSVIISAHCSFAALHLHRLLQERGVDVPIAAWATTALTARKSGPRSVHVSGIRAKLDVATLPVRHAQAGLDACRALFGDRFEPREDVLAIMLSNLNPPAHVANMLGNLTRAERGEDWPNYGSITQGVGRIVDAMDVERLALAGAFGLSVRSVQDHYVHSFGVAPGPVGEMAAAVYRNRPELLGPKTLDTRFITEDVPFGLVPLEALGQVTGVALPLHQAGIALFDAICARNFRAENDLLPALDLGRFSAAQLHRELRGD